MKRSVKILIAVVILVAAVVVLHLLGSGFIAVVSKHLGM